MLNKELTFYADIPVICPVIKTAKPAVVDFLHHVAEMGIEQKGNHGRADETARSCCPEISETIRDTRIADDKPNKGEVLNGTGNSRPKDIDFVLFDQLGVQALSRNKRFAEFNRKTIEMVSAPRGCTRDEGISKPACRSWLQTTLSCIGKEPLW